MTKHSILIPALALALVVPASGAGPTADGWVSLFDGKTLEGWTVRGGHTRYTVEDGAIVGTTAEGSPNTFLCKGDYGDFELELEVRCDPRLNSGVQVRSHVYGPESPRAGVVYGPQCEVARRETGTAGRFYDEGRRGRWLAEIRPEAKAAFKDDDWNRYRIVVQGNRYRCSTPKQLPWVVETFYKGRTALIVLRIDPVRLKSPLKWESPPDSGERFPHVYGPLNLDAVVEVVPLEDLLSEGARD